MGRHGKKGPRIYNELRKEIFSGVFKPGQHLSEKLLSERFRASRPSIREVLGQLASQGFITHEANRGAIVTKLSISDLEVIYNILIRCESYAAMLLAKSHSPYVINKLESFCERMEAKRVQLDYPAWARNNDRFHEIIFSACGTSILGDLIQNTRLRIHPFRIVDAGLEKSIYNSEHRKILEAIRSGNARSAERLMAAHMETAKENRIRHFLQYNELLSAQK